MAYDFDRVIERRYTESSKWRKYGEDVIPLWVADMDFASPAPVIRALRERVEHRVFRYGYTLQRSPLHDLFADRREELGRMAELCLARGLAIVADEIHSDLVFPPHRHVPIASLDPAIAGRTITLMAPSKTWNLAGLKFGLAVIPNAALRERFAAARADMVYGVNVLGYTAALAAYRDGEPWLEELLRYLGANRDFLVDYLRRRLAGVAVPPPQGAVRGRRGRGPPRRPPPPLRSGDLASSTLIWRPSRSRPLKRDTASCASSVVAISTKPKPRDRPVPLSVTTVADSTVPAAAKTSRRRSLVTENGRPPMKSFCAMARLLATSSARSRHVPDGGRSAGDAGW